MRRTILLGLLLVTVLATGALAAELSLYGRVKAEFLDGKFVAKAKTEKYDSSGEGEEDVPGYRWSAKSSASNAQIIEYRLQTRYFEQMTWSIYASEKTDIDTVFTAGISDANSDDFWAINAHRIGIGKFEVYASQSGMTIGSPMEVTSNFSFAKIAISLKVQFDGNTPLLLASATSGGRNGVEIHTWRGLDLTQKRINLARGVFGANKGSTAFTTRFKYKLNVPTFGATNQDQAEFYLGNALSLYYDGQTQVTSRRDDWQLKAKTSISGAEGCYANFKIHLNAIATENKKGDPTKKIQKSVAKIEKQLVKVWQKVDQGKSTKSLWKAFDKIRKRHMKAYEQFRAYTDDLAGS